MPGFVNLNGNLVPADQPILKLDNRSFRYGDGLFETMRIAGGKIQLLKEHLQRLRSGAAVIKLNVPEQWSETYLEQEIQKLASANQLGTDGRVRFSLFRNDGGFYTPDDNTAIYAIEVFPVAETNYELNSKGWVVDLFTQYKKNVNQLSSMKSANSLLFVLAGIFKKEQKLDECLLINESGHIIEATSSNIFAVKNGVLYTPPVSDGCVNGVMRNHIIRIAQENRIAVYEISVMQNVLLGADELFLTNAVNGIRWVVAYKQKRYFNNTSKKLIEKLNESLMK